MAGRANQVMVDDDDIDVATPAKSIEEELNGGGQVVGLRDTQAPGVDEFDVVDDAGESQNGQQSREANFSEEESGPKPVIDSGRRRTRAERRQAQQQARQATENKNAELQRRIDELEGRLSTIEPLRAEFDQSRQANVIAVYDQKIQEADVKLDQAEQGVANVLRAISQGDEEAVGKLAQAMRQRDDAYMAKAQATTNRSVALAGYDPQNPQGFGNQQQRAQPQQRTVQLSDVGRAKAREFAADIPWFKAQGSDRDSVIMRAIDSQVLADGFNPDTDDYWDELEFRAAQRLPHRFVDSEPQTQTRQAAPARRQQAVNSEPQRRGPMTSGGSDRSNGSGGRTRVVLSPERKQAMVQVGAIDNSGSILNRDKYTRILKGYAEFDRINGAAR